jgi:hypothetical protein
MNNIPNPESLDELRFSSSTRRRQRVLDNRAVCPSLRRVGRISPLWDGSSLSTLTREQMRGCLPLKVRGNGRKSAGVFKVRPGRFEIGWETRHVNTLRLLLSMNRPAGKGRSSVPVRFPQRTLDYFVNTVRSSTEQNNAISATI